ncbi:hypothetical protein [Streptomyces sp. NPDC047130]|uniref:hypothetical protein n=1 Tax=Streptomyces sp. NPDC047130 TaxID=3155261 RepID=UPI0033EF525A
MAWRDRLRRRAAGPTVADGTSGAGPDRGAPDAGASSVPGDWDGGWRRTPPPRLTVSRAPLGVSDGLAFRADLASWQNPSFDSGLGHAVLPTAPTGLVRGVTRPAAAPQATGGGGGPLLLRSLRAEGAEEPQGGAAEAGVADTRAVGAPAVGARAAGARAAGAGGRGAGASGGTPRPSADRAPQVARRTRPGARASTTAPPNDAPVPSTEPSASSGAATAASGAATAASGAATAASGAVPAGVRPVVARPGRDGATGSGPADDAPRERGLTPGSSPAVLSAQPSSAPPAVQRTAEPGTRPVVAPSDAGRGPTAPEIPLVRRVSPVPSAAADGAPVRPAAEGFAPRTRSGSPGPGSGRASGAGGRAPRGADGPDSGADAPRPSVRPRPAGPSLTVARRPAGPVRRVPALRPVTLPAPDTRTTTPTAPATPTRDASTRAPLGAPLSELPPTAVPLAKEAAAPPAAPGGRDLPGPPLPVVQRRTDDAGGGEGSPPGGGGTDRPARTGARARGGLGAPLPSLPPSAEVAGASARGPVPDGPASRPTADAPLLGRGGVQRSLAADAPGPNTAPHGTAPHAAAPHGTAHLGAGPATPVVTPPPPTTVTAGGSPERAPAVDAPGPAPRGQRRPGTASPGGPRPAAGKPHGAPSGAAGPVPLVAARRVAPGASPGQGGGGPRPSGVVATRPLPVSRSLSLLAARPLSLNTQVPEGSAPPPARSGGRPVVAARWATTPDAVARTADGTAPVRTPASGPGGAPPVPAGPRGRRATTGRTGAAGSAARPTGGPAPVQRVPVVRPAPPASPASGTPAPGTGASARAAAAPARALPVTAPQAAPLADRPPAVPGFAAAPGSPTVPGDVPVVRWSRGGSDGGTGGTSTTVQRTGPRLRSGAGAGDRVPPGTPAKAAPAGGRPRSASAPAPAGTPASASSTARGADPERDPGLDLDDLARRLLDPVARLLRAELRRGRERTGRPHDGRR